jgi:hypothetical protein
MAASAPASFAARSLVVIVSGAGSWGHEALGAPPSSVNSADMQPDSIAPHGRLARPDLFRRFTKFQNSHCRSSQTFRGRRWVSRVNEGLPDKVRQSPYRRLLKLAFLPRMLPRFDAGKQWGSNRKSETLSPCGNQRSSSRTFLWRRYLGTPTAERALDFAQRDDGTGKAPESKVVSLRKQ